MTITIESMHAALIAAGWTVFTEADASQAAVGLYREPGAGIEGVWYCDADQRFTAPTLIAAYTAAVAWAACPVARN
ncbi:MAG TPA: hypothetical protein VNL77_22435 [Roseiflexaceae bacterium]|nr:hypothetical protein [Roseiflexaceae bacterium]